MLSRLTDLILASNDAGGPGLVSSYALDAKTGKLAFLDSASSGGKPQTPNAGVAAVSSALDALCAC
jgi:hypothetical protein